jgi:hypothetical protein
LPAGLTVSCAEIDRTKVLVSASAQTSNQHLTALWVLLPRFAGSLVSVTIGLIVRRLPREKPIVVEVARKQSLPKVGDNRISLRSLTPPSIHVCADLTSMITIATFTTLWL